MKIERHAILLIFRTERGKEFISRIASPKRFWKVFGSIGILIGILGMGIFFFLMGLNLYCRYSGCPPVLEFKPLIPGWTIPFWYSIIGLFTVLIVHELAHGILARSEDVSLKSLGAVFFAVLPIGAFVEPDEEELKKKSPAAKLRVYSVGSFGNILLAVFGLMLVSIFSSTLFGPTTIKIGGIINGSPAEGILEAGMTLEAIDGREISFMEDFKEATKNIRPNQEVSIRTDKGLFKIKTVPREKEPEKGLIGIYNVQPVRSVKEKWKHVYFSLYWIILLNQGIGLVNLAPLHFGVAATDGHYILKEILSKLIKTESAEKISTFISALTLLAVVFSIVSPSPVM